VTYNTSGSGSVTGVGFQPDLLWIKRTDTTENYFVNDSVRGGNKSLGSNLITAEVTNSNFISSYNSDGFSHGTDSIFTNGSCVAWNWKAGGTAVTNNDGNRPSSVSVNDDAGFSIVSYTGNAVNGETYGHGLTLTPEMVIVKAREGSYLSGGWGVFGSVLSSTTALRLDSTAATQSAAGVTNSVLPTATTFSVADNYNHTGSGHIAYCFHSVDGYSKVGSYTGNQSTDGTFVYCGFSPAYVMIKNIDDTGQSWNVLDSERKLYNPRDRVMRPNLNSGESGVGYSVDLVSNGFKARTTDGGINTSPFVYIFIAFAEHPFKYANAR
jgi:hypothetical protein